MARADNLPDDVLDAIAEQVETMIVAVSDRAPLLHGAQIEMKTFQLWALGADALTQPSNDISQIAAPTGRWHHQVAYGGLAESFARSIPLGAETTSWRVTEFFESRLAGQIAKAADWIERSVPGDPLVRLLIVPAYQVHAFWLSEAGGNQVYVIDCPSSFAHLHSGQLLGQVDFLESLRKEQHIVGRVRS